MLKLPVAIRITTILAFMVGLCLGIQIATLLQQPPKAYEKTLSNNTKVLLVPKEYDAMHVLNEFNMIEKFDDYKAGPGDEITPSKEEHYGKRQ